MDEDKFALVERIIKDIHLVLAKIAELRAFDIVPVDTNIRNKSPVLHLENCLGLESWCIKHVYMYSYSEIIDRYCTKGRRKTFNVSLNSERLIKLLNVTLLLNPELSLFWNKRRMLVLKCLLDKFYELHFTRLILSRKPKCNDAFTYRRWLLDIMFKDDSLQNNNIQDIINEELNICTLASDKSPNNYHSWNHRIWLINKLKTLEKQFNVHYQYIKEYNFSEQWIAKNVSDYSCCHYRQFCIKNVYLLNDELWIKFTNSVNLDLRKVFVRILAANFPKDSTIQVSEDDLLTYSENNLVNLLLFHSVKKCYCILDNVLVCRKLEILFHELALNNELIRFYKHHETLWYHRRFIIHEIVGIIYEHFCLTKSNGSLIRNTCKKCTYDDERQKQAKMVRYDSNCIYSSVLFTVLLSHERKFVEEMRMNLDNYADRHEKYLKFVEGFSNIM
ncbi:unnamed protein product [Parnassius apollo]|uniref:(apollo) hypothetical protein n=1 Tax=Parnassius apollo TaxID=110799 RepID=A0A8S3WKI8_PARAO|nr:unnamed protein product [Parnassius apollo]